MKKTLFSLLVLVPACAMADIPTRKAGLWEVTVDAGGMKQTMQQCTDAETDAKMMDANKNPQKMGINCVKNETKQIGNTWVTDSDCTFGPTRIITSSETSGDFQTNYKSVIKARYEPPLMGQKETTTNLAGKWVGPCKEDQKPGDMILSNGMKMNINSMMPK
jgi:hypothetical protein